MRFFYKACGPENADGAERFFVRHDCVKVAQSIANGGKEELAAETAAVVLARRVTGDPVVDVV